MIGGKKSPRVGGGLWKLLVAGFLVAVQGACGVLLAWFAVTSWQKYDDLDERRAAVDSWAGARDFAVFHPVALGGDLEDIRRTGGSAETMAQADLFLQLEKVGALYVDALDFEPGVPPSESPLPARVMKVNVNYLDRYPLRDESGSAVRVDRDEQAWVVAVPATFKAQERSIREFLRMGRVGRGDFQGAVQAEQGAFKRIPPARFRTQNVRIVWTEPGQKVFSYSPTVNPDDGNRVVDPIVEIMTPANSLTIDRANAVTGGIGTAMKVRVDGDPQRVLRELQPTLKRLRLDDNLQHLVFPGEAMQNEFAETRRMMMWESVVAGGVLVVMLIAGWSFVAVLCDRARRVLIVRRLHGFGFLRTYRGVLSTVGVTWVATVVVALLYAAWSNADAASMPEGMPAPMSRLIELPRLMLILIAMGIVEAVFASLVATVLERRNAVKRLKEL